MKAKAVAAAARTQSSAAQASTSEMQAEKVLMQNTMKYGVLTDHLKMAEEAAKKMAIAEVQAELTRKYKELDEWRSKVL